MDAFDCERIDKVMNEKVMAVYGNPSRHKFYPERQGLIDDKVVGPRGGKVAGRKTVCFHCGQKEHGHAQEDENL